MHAEDNTPACTQRPSNGTRILGREPGPGLRVFSATFFYYHFLLTYTMGHRKFTMTTPNSGPFALRGPKKNFSGLK